MFKGKTIVRDVEWLNGYVASENVGSYSTYEIENIKLLLYPIAIRLQEILERLEKLENDPKPI